MYADTMDYANPLSTSKYPVGSPFAMGSLQNQFYPGCSPSTLMGPLDIPDLHHKLASSMENQHGSLLRMISGITPTVNDTTMCRDYTCCGIQLSDLHALVEHFEDKHIVVLDSPTLQPVHPTIVVPPPTGNVVHANAGVGPAQVSASDPQIDTMDEMDMDVDVDDSHSSGSGSHSGASTPSPPLTPVLPFDTTAIRRSSSSFASIPLVATNSGSASTSPRLETAFNRYADYTEFSAMLPGTITSNESTANPARNGAHSRQMSKSKPCLPPALLSSSNTPESSRAPSPTQSSSDLSRQASTSAAGTLTRPANSLLLSKPFRCPKPGCNKSYKQANGLKYHLQHGSCNFAPRDESMDCLSEKEAEARLKPYQCQVPPCTRRYKNMNGLRYHYQHSGAHGAIGLALLASGQHDHVHTNHHHQNSDLNAHGQYHVKRSRTSSTVSSANNSTHSSPVPSRTGTPLSSPITPHPQSTATNFTFFHHHQIQPQQMMMTDV